MLYSNYKKAMSRKINHLNMATFLNLNLNFKFRFYLFKEKMLSSEIIGVSNAPIIVNILERGNHWTKISSYDLYDNKPIEGWVLSRYVKKI